MSKPSFDRCSAVRLHDLALKRGAAALKGVCRRLFMPRRQRAWPRRSALAESQLVVSRNNSKRMHELDSGLPVLMHSTCVAEKAIRISFHSSRMTSSYRRTAFQVDATFCTTKAYLRLTADSVARSSWKRIYPEQLPSRRTMTIF